MIRVRYMAMYAAAVGCCYNANLGQRRAYEPSAGVLVGVSAPGSQGSPCAEPCCASVLVRVDKQVSPEQRFLLGRPFWTVDTDTFRLLQLMLGVLAGAGWPLAAHRIVLGLGSPGDSSGSPRWRAASRLAS